MALSEAAKARNRAYIRRRREQFAAEGRCKHCGGETDGVHKMCFACRVKYAAWQTERKRRGSGDS